MIPTRFRARLPQYLSYPIGAETISESLAGVPHVELLSVTFRDQAVWPASAFRRLLTDRLPYRIMEASYQPACKPGIRASNAMVEGGWYDVKWELLVYPVLREVRHLANRLLRDEGLPSVAWWLRSSNESGWGARWQRIELVFSPADESLVAHQSCGV